jgi:hypothetical protein
VGYGSKFVAVIFARAAQRALMQCSMLDKEIVGEAVHEPPGRRREKDAETA